jgi:uncharacterized membrane protein YdfJ with MMPL/SSD domain
MFVQTAKNAARIMKMAKAASKVKKVAKTTDIVKDYKNYADAARKAGKIPNAAPPKVVEEMLRREAFAKSANANRMTTGKAAKLKPKTKKITGYGENKAYARTKDMQKSEFYRDRHNAGKTYSSPSNNKKKAVATVGTAVGLGAAAAYKNKKK